MTEELKIEQTDSLNAQAAEAGMDTGAKKDAVSYGKFKDADALYSAYNSLQAEFTRRCQRLKELEERDKKTTVRGDTGADFGGKTKETAAKVFRADENKGSGETEKTGMQGNFGDTLAEAKASSAASASLKPNGDSLPIKSDGVKPERKVNPLLAEGFTDSLADSHKGSRTDNSAGDAVVNSAGNVAEKSVSEESTDTGEKVKNEENSENKISENKNAFSGGAKPAQEAKEGEEAPARVISEKEKEDVLKEYLEGILTKKTGAILMEGAGASLKTPRSRPKTVEEAGRLFRDSFGNIH